MHLDLGDVPTWGLLLFALVGAVFAIMAFRKQSEEVGLLKEDAEAQAGERHREAGERRGAQAASITLSGSICRGPRCHYREGLDARPARFAADSCSDGA